MSTQPRVGTVVNVFRKQQEQQTCVRNCRENTARVPVRLLGDRFNTALAVLKRDCLLRQLSGLGSLWSSQRSGLDSRLSSHLQALSSTHRYEKKHSFSVMASSVCASTIKIIFLRLATYSKPAKRYVNLDKLIIVSRWISHV